LPDNGLRQICFSNVALSSIMNWGREMSKIIFLIILAGLAVVACAAININNVNASQQPEFIQVSVLAKSQADYGVDEQMVAIPAVSIEIIEDAAHDFQSESSVRVITYISLPAEEPKQGSEGNGDPETMDEVKHNNGQGNGNGNNSNQGNDGNGSQNQNGNGNGPGNNNKKDRDREDKPKKVK
jgi:hypothetical protein